MFSMGQPNISAIAIWTHYMLRGHFLFRLGNVRDSRCCGTDRCLVVQVSSSSSHAFLYYSEAEHSRIIQAVMEKVKLVLAIYCPSASYLLAIADGELEVSARWIRSSTLHAVAHPLLMITGIFRVEMVFFSRAVTSSPYIPRNCTSIMTRAG